MTVVNTATGEIIETLSEREARDAIVEAQAEFKSSIAHFEHAWAILLGALDRGAHRALGYRSESDLLAHEFDGYLNALDVANRRVVVRELSARGASTRAIASVVQVSQPMVVKDKQAVAAGDNRVITSQSPAPSEGEAESPRASGSEGTEARDQQQGPEDYPTAPEAPAATCERPAPDEDEDDLDAEADIIAAAELMEDAATNDAPTQPLATVTGIDGKTYTRPAPAPAPSKPRRRPLTDAFDDGIYKLRKQIESLHRLTGDDRWARNHEQLASAKHRNELLVINDLLQQVIESITHEEPSR